MQKEPIKIPREPQPAPTPSPPPAQAQAPTPEPIPAPVQYTQVEQSTPAPNLVSQQPDVIPTQRDSMQAESDLYEPLAPPDAFSGKENGAVAESVPEIVQSVPAQSAHNEQIYSNIPEQEIYSNIDVIQQQEQETANHAPAEAPQLNPAALTGNEEYDLSEYIEDTKIKAVALYDYQASAEDEISFDPNDIITHIEMVRSILNQYQLCVVFLY